MRFLGSLSAVACLLLLGSSSAALNITFSQPGVPLLPGNLPPSHAASDGEKVAELFLNLGRTTVWKLIEKIPFEGETFEPEGIVRFGEDRYFVSAGEYTARTVKFANGSIINGTDRSPGAGFAHLMVFNGKGKRIADATLTERGSIEYHNGGLDYDGKYIWAAIGQYRPNTTANIVRIDPYTAEPTTILRASDHYGGIVHDTETDEIVALNWGSRNASTWNLRQKFAQPPAFTPPKSVVRNPSFFVDYQDCKFLGHLRAFNRRPVMLCSGVAGLANSFSTRDLGGIAIVDMETMVPLAELPITLVTDLGVTMTGNPVDFAVVGGQLRFYWMPDQHNSTMYVYEAQVNSPYQY